jgi:hypothetical protein
MSPCPIFWIAITCKYVQSLLVIVNCLLNILGLLTTDAILVSIRQVVLGSCPFPGMRMAGQNFQRLLAMTNGLLVSYRAILIQACSP